MASSPPTCQARQPRHVLFHPDWEQNNLYKFRDGTGTPHRNVVLLGEAAISTKKIIIYQLSRRLVLADNMEDEDDATAEREAVQPKMDEANDAIKAFKKLLAEVIRDWQMEENRVIGHIVLSPPLVLMTATTALPMIG